MLLLLLGITLRVSPQKVQSELSRRVETLEKINQELQFAIENIQKNLPWPKGSYCIFRNGRCPEGFNYQGGHLSGITFIGNSPYIQEGRFGDSYIKCNQCNNNQWKGDVTLVVCCK